MKIELFDLDLTEEEKKYWRPKFKNFFLLNGKKITVLDEIWKVEVINNICLVAFFGGEKARKEGKGGRNIWAFNEKGEKIWEIEDAGESIARQRIEEGYPPEQFYENGKLKMGHKDTYAGFNVGKQQYVGKVFIVTHCNFTAELDIKTGKAFDWIQGK